MSKPLIYTVRDAMRAEIIVDDLRAAGFAAGAISVLFPDSSGTREFADEHGTRMPEIVDARHGAGLAVDDELGWLVGIDTLASPGRGRFAADSSHASSSAVAVGALIEMGVSEGEARQYEDQLEAGNVLISVHVVGAEETRRARQLLERLGAEDTCRSRPVRTSARRRRIATRVAQGSSRNSSSTQAAGADYTRQHQDSSPLRPHPSAAHDFHAETSPMTARIVGIIMLVVGLSFVLFGLKASDSVADSISEGVTGRYTNTTMWYLIGGSALTVGGAALALVRRDGARNA